MKINETGTPEVLGYAYCNLTPAEGGYHPIPPFAMAADWADRTHSYAFLQREGEDVAAGKHEDCSLHVAACQGRGRG